MGFVRGQTVGTGLGADRTAVKGKGGVQAPLNDLQRAYAFTQVCQAIYKVGGPGPTELQIGPLQPPITLPGSQQQLQAELLYFRPAKEAASCSPIFKGTPVEGLLRATPTKPEQFGIWRVAQLGIVITFRGSYLLEDWISDAEIMPTSLDFSPPQKAVDAYKASLEEVLQDARPAAISPDIWDPAKLSRDISIHQGFQLGVEHHANEITIVVGQLQKMQDGKAELWIAGHSLGGGLTQAFYLNLLSHQTAGPIFKYGGGVCTFGSPLVLTSLSEQHLYDALKILVQHDRKVGPARIQVNNYVNAGDVVPRLLGQDLLGDQSLVDIIKKFLPNLKALFQEAGNYYPLGNFHLIRGDPELGGIFGEDKTPTVTDVNCPPNLIGDVPYAQKVEDELSQSKLSPTERVRDTLGPMYFHHLDKYAKRLQKLLESGATKP